MNQIIRIVLLLGALLLVTPQTRAATNLFYSTNSITIPDLGPASSYPWIINVTGLVGSIEKVTVTLSNFNHSISSDVDIMLSSPFGTNVVLLSAVGLEQVANNITITLDDDAPTALSPTDQAVSGTFKPSDFSEGVYFLTNSPTPNSTNLYDLAGKTANGDWSLWVYDGEGGGSTIGSISNWVLTIITSDTNRPPVISPIPAQQVTEGEHLAFYVGANDSLDNDFITLTASNVPPGMVFTPTNGNTTATGGFNWTNASPVGVYTGRLYATDNDGSSFSDLIITVNAEKVYPEYRISSIASPGGNLVIRWPSTNLTYFLSRSTNLMATNGFIPLVTNIAGTPPENAITTTPSMANGFYRVEVEQP